jgi:hypothetical protein
VLFLDGYSDCA